MFQNRFHILSIVLFSIAISFPNLAHALEFSEIAYDLAGADDKHEWIEIYNEMNVAVNITGYKFSDGSNHLFNAPPVNGSTGSLTIEAGKYAIIADDATTFLADHPSYTGTVIDSTMSLPNYSKDRTEPIILKLLDPEGQTVATASYLPTADQQAGYTLELRNGSFGQSTAAGGSPGGAGQPASSPISYPTGLRMSELMPNPDGLDTAAEWIELENISNLTIGLDGWYFIDKPTASGNTNRRTLSKETTIVAGQFLKIPIAGSMLNNSDEVVSFYSPDDKLIDSVSLPGEAKDNWTYALFNQGWLWTDRPTPGEQNKQALPSPSPVSSNNQLTSKASETLQELKKASQPLSSPLAISGKSNKTSSASLVNPGLGTTSGNNQDKKLSLNGQANPEPSLSLSPSGQVVLDSSLDNRPVARVAGETTNQTDSLNQAIIYLLLPVLSGLFLLSIIVYRFKLISYIARLGNRHDLIT